MSKIKICVYVKNFDYKGDEMLSLIEIYHKHPRSYMLSWSFDKLLNYVKEECYWQDIDINKISGILFVNNEEHWYYSVPSPILF